jgi:hypothetical protein
VNESAGTLTGAVTSVAAGELLALSATESAGERGNLSWTGFLLAGDVIRPHISHRTDADVQASSVRFDIVKVS